MTNAKIKTISELIDELASKRSSVKISACSGSFDILHSGHISYLKEAREHGDILVVFLNSDESIRLYKGPSRPILSFDQRSLLLAEFSFVDYIVELTELNPLTLIEKLKPDVFCNGSDWGDNALEKSLILSYNGTYKVVSSQTRNAYSTTDIINKVSSSLSTVSPKIIFLDRDGILIVDRHYIYKTEDVEILSATIEDLIKLKNDGWKFIVISNQSGIGRGLFSKEDVDNVNSYINELLSKHGITIEKFYYCPHTPDDNCLCRKPGTKLFEDAARDFGIPLSKSWMIGDKLSDIEAGRRSNMKTIFIGTIINETNSLTTPTFIVDDFSQISNLILSNSNN